MSGETDTDISRPSEPGGKNHCGPTPTGDGVCETDLYADSRCACWCSRCGPWNQYRDDFDAWNLVRAGEAKKAKPDAKSDVLIFNTYVRWVDGDSWSHYDHLKTIGTLPEAISICRSHYDAMEGSPVRRSYASAEDALFVYRLGTRAEGDDARMNDQYVIEPSVITVGEAVAQQVGGEKGR